MQYLTIALLPPERESEHLNVWRVTLSHWTTVNREPFRKLLNRAWEERWTMPAEMTAQEVKEAIRAALGASASPHR